MAGMLIQSLIFSEGCFSITHNNKFNAMVQTCIDMLEDGRVERPYTAEAVTELKKLL